MCLYNITASLFDQALGSCLEIWVIPGQQMMVKCRSPVSWPWTDHAQISLIHSRTPPKCSMRAIVALINNLGIVYHQYCSSSYLDYPADPGSSYRSRQWKSSSNLIPTRPPELQSQSRLPTDLDESPKAPSTLNSPVPTQSLSSSSSRFSTAPALLSIKLLLGN